MRCSVMAVAATVLAAAGVDAQPACEAAVTSLDAALLEMTWTIIPAAGATCQNNGTTAACQSALTNVEAETNGLKKLASTIATECHPSGAGEQCKQFMHNGTEFLNGALANLDESKKSCAGGNQTMCVAYFNAFDEDMTDAVGELAYGADDVCSHTLRQQHRRAARARRVEVRAPAGAFTGTDGQCQDELAAANETATSIQGDLKAAQNACAASGASPGCAARLGSASGLMGKAAAQLQASVHDCKNVDGTCNSMTNLALTYFYIVVAHVNTAQAQCSTSTLICALEIHNALQDLDETFNGLGRARKSCH